MKSTSHDPSRRLQRVNQEVQHALSRILNRELEPLQLPAGSVTVTSVRVSPDLRHAYVNVIPLGGASAEALDLVKALKEHVPYLRRALAKQVKLKYLPDLHFVADHSLDNSLALERAMHSEKVLQDLKKS